MLYGQLITLGSMETKSTDSVVWKNKTFDCEVFPSQVHENDVKWFCKRGQNENYYSDTKSTQAGRQWAREGEDGNAACWSISHCWNVCFERAVQEYMLPGEIFLSASFIATPQIKDFNTRVLENCRLK